MQQVLSIFRKDVRHLWPGILVVLLLIATHAVFQVRSGPDNILQLARVNTIATVLSMLLPLAFWYLIALLIYQEALPGDRQFWLTRPYRRAGLLASKLLFLLVFITLPMFVSDCYALGVQGFPVLGVWPELLLRQLQIAAAFVLPAFAIAVVTTGLAQFVLAVFIAVLALILQTLSLRGASVDGALLIGDSPFVIFLVVLVAVVVWQYSTRRTTPARLFLLAATFAFLPGLWAASRLVSYSKPRPLPMSANGFNPGISYDLQRTLPAAIRAQEQPSGLVLARIPLRVTGLPPKVALRGNALIKVEAGGKSWPSPGAQLSGAVDHIGDEYWQYITVPRSDLDLLGKQSVSLQANFHLEVVTDQVEAIIQITDPSFVIPNVGRCRTFQGTLNVTLACRAGLTETDETEIQIKGPAPATISVSSTATPWGLSPTTDLISSLSLQPRSTLALIPRRKLAEFQRTLDITGIQLAHYLQPTSAETASGISGRP